MMTIENIPEIYLKGNIESPDLFIYDFRMTNEVVKSKVNLSMNMFSFLQVGKKQVHFSNTSVEVNPEQSILIKNGNYLWTELLDKENIYYCKLFFFSESKLKGFLEKHSDNNSSQKNEIPYFIIQNDDYLNAYLKTLNSTVNAPSIYWESLLSIKFEEIMLYLLNKYGDSFERYLCSLISINTSPLKKVVEGNVYSNLNLEEIAFLCNMSLSTFKRYFKTEYGTTPGKWLQDKRLQRAKKLLQKKNVKPSDIYLDMGYNNLSNFSTAFKNKFGKSPREIEW